MGGTQVLMKVTQESCGRAWYRLHNTQAPAQAFAKQPSNFLKYSWKKDRLVQCSTNKTEQMRSHYPVEGQTAETEFEGLLSAGRRLQLLPNANLNIFFWFTVLRKSEKFYSQP